MVGKIALVPSPAPCRSREAGCQLCGRQRLAPPICSIDKTAYRPEDHRPFPRLLSRELAGDRGRRSGPYRTDRAPNSFGPRGNQGWVPNVRMRRRRPPGQLTKIALSEGI